MMIDYSIALQHIYPDIRYSDYALEDLGNGSKIVAWFYQNGAQPTEQALQDAWDAIAANAGKSALITQVKAKMEAIIDSGIVFNNHTFKSNFETACEINIAKESGLTILLIKNSSGSFVSFTQSTIQELIGLIGVMRQVCCSNAASLINAINGAQDQEAIDAIDINLGWPDVPYNPN